MIKFAWPSSSKMDGKAWFLLCYPCYQLYSKSAFFVVARWLSAQVWVHLLELKLLSVMENPL